MRVTTQMMAAQVTHGLQQAYRRVADAQETVTSGRRINHLSDDPIGATRALRFRGFEEALSQYKRNIDNSLPFLEQADATLGAVTDSLQRAKEIALAMANDTYTAAQRAASAKEIHQIFLQVLSEANTKVEDRFLFGGFRNGTAPFLEGVNRVDYGGDNGEIAIQIGPASALPINFLGNEVFQGAGMTGGVGIFDVLQDLELVLNGGSSPHAITLAINLDDALVPGAGFSPADAVGTEAPTGTWVSEADFSAPVTVFDSQGQGHNATFVFAKTGATTYSYRALVESTDISGGTPGNLYQIAPEGTLEFNPDGTLNVGASTINDITLLGLANGAADITIAAADLSFAGSTQSTEPSAVLSLTQTNTNGIQAQIGRLDAALDQMSSVRAGVGARLNSAQFAGDAALLLKDRSTAQRSNIEDADVLSAYSDFTRFQYAFQAALQSAAQIVQPSLLDFLG
jgi:flagellar hook-associated protein 3 FlgL